MASTLHRASGKSSPKRPAYFQISAEPFERLFDLREGRTAARDLDFQKLLEDYMMQISTVIEAVDRL